MQNLKKYLFGGIVGVGLGLTSLLGCSQKTMPVDVKSQSKIEYLSYLNIKQTGFDWGYEEIIFRKNQEGDRENFEINVQQGVNITVYGDGNFSEAADGQVDRIYYHIYGPSSPSMGTSYSVTLTREKDFKEHMCEFDLGDKLMRSAKIRFGDLLRLRTPSEFKQKEKSFERDPSIQLIRFEAGLGNKDYFYRYFRK